MAAFEESEEAVLLRQAVTGSGEAFALLVRLHQSAVRWCLVRYVRDPETADDLAQDVFLAAYRDLATCRSTGSLRGWLLGIARNVAVQHVRSEARRRLRERGPLATQLAQWRIEQLEQDPEVSVDYERKLETLRHCVEHLSPESRRAVEEHYFQRQTVESIAQRRGRAGGAVRMMLLRIRKALGECIRKNLRNQR